MQHTVGLKDLRENMEHYEHQVRKGHSFVVMKRSKPIFTINPVDEAGWETVIDFTPFRRNGILATELLARLGKA